MDDKNIEPIIFHDYESFVIRRFEESISLCRGMVKHAIEDYQESDDEDIRFILLNLARIVKARGYGDFKAARLSKSRIDNAIKSEDNYMLNPIINDQDRNVINKMITALKIKEQI
jgi:hypothetical protein